MKFAETLTGYKVTDGAKNIGKIDCHELGKNTLVIDYIKVNQKYRVQQDVEEKLQGIRYNKYQRPEQQSGNKLIAVYAKKIQHL